MSDIIKLLPDSVANQIAAGEVIQRPASVVKELVENAVDAGASDIRIFIKDAGRTLIQVVDNGKGMSETDARMAFERHATSKIREAGDLFTLHTMGFRGEALPSICAVAQVELKTRTPEGSVGTRLVINGSHVETQEPTVCDVGTNMMVKNIFFNVPARRKFLKSDNVELSNIMREFERLALVNNHIRMSIDTGSRILDLRAGSFKQRIADIWKNNLDLHLIPIEVDTSLIKIHGYVSRPEFARRRNPLQYLIVNGRNMRHPYFHKAIMTCFEPLIAADTQPCYFLKFEVDPGSIDVNIHPTKNEIKFEYEQEIWPILQASIKAALGKFGAVPSIDFNSDVLPVDPLPLGVNPERPTLDIPEGYNPFAVEKNDRHESIAGYTPAEFKRKDHVPRNWDSLYSDFLNGTRESSARSMASQQPSSVDFTTGAGVADNMDNDNVISTPFGVTSGGSLSLDEIIETLPDEDPSDSRQSLFPENKEIAPGSFCVQHALRYIITTSRDGLIIIDQHRAHVKVLFEEFMQKIGKGETVSRTMMFPEQISLDPEHQEVLVEVEPELVKLGFRLEYEEEDRWKILAVPALLPTQDVRDIILRILDSIGEGGVNYGNESEPLGDISSKLALVLARGAAIQGGRKLTTDEMEHLVGELFSLSDPQYTPNGNPVYCLLDSARLESMFR